MYVCMSVCLFPTRVHIVGRMPTLHRGDIPRSRADTNGSFRKLGVPYFGILTIRILSETPKSVFNTCNAWALHRCHCYPRTGGFLAWRDAEKCRVSFVCWRFVCPWLAEAKGCV